ncbi:MAG: hypothetical protein C4332_12305 [Meiothermus sp.]
MKKFLVAAAIFGVAGLGLAQQATQGSAFVDVAPCHWAKEAVDRITDASAVAKPQPSASLAANAVQQVFEGLKCGNPEWSAKFIAGAPSSFLLGASKLNGFELRNVQTSVAGNTARVRFQVVANLATGAVTRSGEARLSFTPEGWKTDYATLSALNLPVFPK